jgi:hypothetical protein
LTTNVTEHLFYRRALVEESHEEEAQQAEKQMTKDPSPLAEEASRLMEGEMTFWDLEEPWLVSK